MADNIKVCIRCRPFNKRELELQSEKCVEMPISTQICVFDPTEEGGNRNEFAYDRCFWSTDDTSFEKADQQTLQDEVGQELLENAIKGYNDTLFAYGQTGSGKTWSVIGGSDIHGADAGLLPRLITNLYVKLRESSEWQFTVTVSYLEIYNEQLRDLFAPKSGSGGPGAGDQTRDSGANKRASTSSGANSQNLEIKVHPTLGIFVPGMTEAVCMSEDEVMKMLDFGFNQRAVAETSMNPRSSRSHTIFTISVVLYQGTLEKPTKQLNSKINMVDLAGSERQKKTNAEGDHLKEGAAINQSLSNLSLVIHALAAQCSGKSKKKEHVPYRNSKLTHFLQPALSGNSKTVMIAAVSPALNNIQETLSTLRFANSAKEIKTKPTTNEQSNQSVMDQLKDQIKELQKQLAAGGGTAGPAQLDPNILKEIQELKELKDKFGESFEEKLAQGEMTRALHDDHMDAMGLMPPDDPDAPCLLSISADAALSGKMCFYVTKKKELVLGSGSDVDVRLAGLGITEKMCGLRHLNDEALQINLFLDAEKKLPEVYRNGMRLAPTDKVLNHNDRLFFGKAFAFRVLIPAVARTEEKREEVLDKEFDDLVGELMDTQSENFHQTREFMETIGEHVGQQNAERFLKQFAQCLPLVNEANQIAKEVRPQDRLLMRLDVLIDPMQFRNAPPALCVRLYKLAPPEDGPVDNEDLKREYVVNTTAAIAEDLEDIFVDGVVDGRAVVELAVFSWTNFLTRLHGMRETFDDWHHGKLHNWDLEPDPWSEVSYLDHHEHHVEKSYHKSAAAEKDVHLDVALENLQNTNNLRNASGALLPNAGLNSKIGELDIEAVAAMSHEDRQKHAQTLFRRLRESLTVLRRELEIDTTHNR